MAVDLLPESKKIFELNFPGVPFVQGNVFELPIASYPDHDILTAGFPCQTYSIAGNKAGTSDPRGQVFFQLVKILSARKPRFAMLENVPALITFQKGTVFQHFLQLLTDIGYRVKWKVLKTSTFTDVPQARRRVYLMCFRDQADHDRWNFPADRDATTAPLRPLLSFIDKDADVPALCWYKANDTKHWQNIVAHCTTNFFESQVVYNARRQRVEVSPPGICPTILTAWGGSSTTCGMINLAGRVRRMTANELFKLQAFPMGHGYQFPDKIGYTTLCRLAGNAISVNVVAKLAQSLFDMMALPPGQSLPVASTVVAAVSEPAGPKLPRVRKTKPQVSVVRLTLASPLAAAAPSAAAAPAPSTANGDARRKPRVKKDAATVAASAANV